MSLYIYIYICMYKHHPIYPSTFLSTHLPIYPSTYLLNHPSVYDQLSFHVFNVLRFRVRVSTPGNRNHHVYYVPNQVGGVLLTVSAHQPPRRRGTNGDSTNAVIAIVVSSDRGTFWVPICQRLPKSVNFAYPFPLSVKALQRPHQRRPHLSATV